MHNLIIISGPSGVGKGTIVRRLLKDGDFALSVSCTTRQMREGEREGESYFFIDDEKFSSMIENGEFLEYSEHFSYRYGTPKAFVEKQLLTKDVILEIEVNGARQVKKAYPEAVLIMILPPDENALIARLKHRGSESDESIKERVSRTTYELSQCASYDYTVINDDLETAVNEVKRIINSIKN